jgi:UDP-N-acetylmuramyl pentapeptide phosphotransferase/UDP-N-acetylglucosamine-1-phosphate transferase
LSNLVLDFFYKLPISFYVALCVSFFTCLLIVKTQRWHRIFTLDSSEGIQKLHQEPTPRIGGLGIFVAVVCAYFFENADRSNILGPLILAGLSAFLFGLAEDLTKQVNITTRLLATILAGVVGWAITGISLTRVGFNLIDPLFKYQGLSVLFTAIAIGGIANAINMIDGLNGLASSMMVIALVAIATIAHSVGDVGLAVASLTVSAAVFGFFLVNWPWGKIFLGDGGSYFGGFALAWSCVLLVERNPSISPFAALLICIYPFTDAMFSVYRRKVRSRSPTGPDVQHLHSLIYRRYLSSFQLRVQHNSVAGLIIGLLSLPPAICAFYLKESNFFCFIFFIFFLLCYLALYLRVIKFKWF